MEVSGSVTHTTRAGVASAAIIMACGFNEAAIGGQTEGLALVEWLAPRKASIRRDWKGTTEAQLIQVTTRLTLDPNLAAATWYGGSELGDSIDNESQWWDVNGLLHDPGRRKGIDSESEEGQEDGMIDFD